MGKAKVQENFDPLKREIAQSAARLTKLNPRLAKQTVDDFNRDLAKEVADYRKDAEQLRERLARDLKKVEVGCQSEVLTQAYMSTISEREKQLESAANKIYKRELQRIDEVIDAAKKPQK